MIDGYSPNRLQIKSAIKGHDRRFKLRTRFRDRHPFLATVLHGMVFLIITALFLISLIVIREAAR